MANCGKCGAKINKCPSLTGKYCSQRCYHSIPKKRSDPVERFWRYVRKTDDCWEWTGCMKGPGRHQYGHMALSGYKRVTSHRFSWEIHFGPIPEGMFVCHRCDNPSCVRPDHLFLGTNSENMKDRWNKGRYAKVNVQNRGSKHGMSKLTEEQVTEIRRDYVPWKRNCVNDLAAKYGITRSGVYGVVRNINWKHM